MKKTKSPRRPRLVSTAARMMQIMLDDSLRSTAEWKKRGVMPPSIEFQKRLRALRRKAGLGDLP